MRCRRGAMPSAPMRYLVLAALRAAAAPQLTKWQLRRNQKRQHKAGFAPSWTRGETSAVWGEKTDAITQKMAWNEQRHCEYAAGDAKGSRKDAFVVALAYDTADPLPTLAVLNSTASHALKLPEFVVITTRPKRLLGLLRHPRVSRDLPPKLLEHVRVCGGFTQMLVQRPALVKLELLKNASAVGQAAVSRVRRTELLSPFNFAAFYLPHVLQARRILYLDTDTLVQRDVVKTLEHFDLKGKAVAAVEDCSQRFEKYVNFQLLDRHLTRRNIGGLTANYAFNGTTCVFNRGVVLIDPKQWREMGLTLAIEELVVAYVNSRARLWRGGVSQPPFLLALGGRYQKLDLRYNVRGLGRVDMGLAEYESAQNALPQPNVFLRKELARVGTFRQKFHPFVAPLADRAYVLHFTGEMKPWRVARAFATQWRTHGASLTPQGHVSGGCALDAQLSGRMDRRIYYCRKRAPCGDARFARFNSTTQLFASACLARFPLCSLARGIGACASVWHAYVSEAAVRVADIE